MSSLTSFLSIFWLLEGVRSAEKMGLNFIIIESIYRESNEVAHIVNREGWMIHGFLIFLVEFFKRTRRFY